MQFLNADFVCSWRTSKGNEFQMAGAHAAKERSPNLTVFVSFLTILRSLVSASDLLPGLPQEYFERSVEKYEGHSPVKKL